MIKLDLSSIQNNVKRQENKNVKQIVNSKTQVKPSQNNSKNLPTFEIVFQSIKNNSPNVNTNNLSKPKSIPKEVKSEIKVELIEQQKNKTIALLNLYKAKFPEKLERFKNKNFDKTSDSELIKLKSIFYREVSTLSSLNMAISISGKVLEIYEYLICDHAGINIKGISRLQNNKKYQDRVKAVLLKYMSNACKLCKT
jgi:hypothetical protein